MLSLQISVVLCVAAACYGQTYFTCPSSLTSSHQNTANCNAYWVCENSVAYPWNCKTEYYYDPDRNDCFYKFTPQGCTMPIEARSGTANVNTNSCAYAVNGKYPDTTDCSSYYWCQNNVPYKQTCASGTYFDPNSGNCYANIAPQGCQMPYSTRQYATNAYSCATTNNGKYQDTTDCSSYYSCQNNVPYKQTCASGTYFDPNSGNCLANFAPQGCQMPYSTRQYATNAFICPDSSTQKYPDTSDCSAYYYCINSVGTRYKCASGQYFDQTYRNCYSGINPSNCKMP